MAEKYFTVDSVATFVHHRGATTLPGQPPAPAGGATVLCVHDAAGNGHAFSGVLDALAGEHRPIAFDLPGHGRSGGLDSLGEIAAMAAHAHALADRLGLTSVVLLGEGMGAAVALEIAATWPSFASAVVLCGGASLDPAPEPAVLDQLRQVTAGRARRQFDTSGYAPDTPRDVYQRAFGEWMKTDPRATVGDLQALVDWPVAERVGAVTAPVTVVVGEHEPAEARAAAEQLAAAVGNGRVVELAGAGRRGVLEQPAGLAAIVAEAGGRRGAGMTLSRSVAIAGVYEHPTRFAPDKTEFQIMAETAKGALDDAGLTIADVDALFAASMTMSGMGIVDLAEYLDIKPDYLDGTNIGGSSFVAHVTHAAAAIHAGLCEVALVLYGSTAASSAMAIGTGMGGGERRDPAASFANPYGNTVVGSYALVAQLHRQRYGTSAEQLAEIAVTMRHHASLNPAAKMRQPITVDDVLASRMVSDPLHLLDCCIISDGGGAVVVTSLERARDLRQRPVTLLGCGESVAHQEIGRQDLLTTAARQSGRKAFGMAGVTHGDIDLCMIYDSFTITVLATLENLGFCEIGEGGAFVSGGRIRLGGELPVNLDGGGLSSNHPGMRGIFLVIEATKQLRGECGDRQVQGAELACVHGTGGTLGIAHSGATLILGATS